MKKVAIIGAGLAGCAAGYVLKQAGYEPVIYELGEKVAPAASGNLLGLFNPRLSAELTPEGRFYKAAFEKALDLFPTLEGIDFNPCGALHLITDEKKENRFGKLLQNWGWGEDMARILSAEEASEVTGVDVSYPALHLPKSGYVSPHKLCEAYTQGIDVQVNNYIDDISAIEADIVILASGPGSNGFKELTDLALMNAVRGQVSVSQETAYSKALKSVICYGGYVMPSYEGVHVFGATFQPWLDHDEIIEQDDIDNLEKLAEFVPDLAEGFEVIDHRAAVRTSSKHRFPVIGKVPGHENLYVSTAHGSHGIISGLMGAYVLAEMITGQTCSLDQEVIERLSPARYSRTA